MRAEKDFGDVIRLKGAAVLFVFIRSILFKEAVWTATGPVTSSLLVSDSVDTQINRAREFQLHECLNKAFSV